MMFQNEFTLRGISARPWIIQRGKLGPGLGDLVHQVEQVPNRTSKPIQFAGYQNIPRPQGFDGLG
jgi:hypothetical protein